jgi:hypothetical protein
MAMGVDGSIISKLLEDDNETELSPSLRGWAAKAGARPGRETLPPEEPRNAGESDEAPVAPEELAPLPTAATPYKAHSRLANKPLATLFFLPEGQLPDGFSYAILERVRMGEPRTPGGSPDLLLRFNGSAVTEVRVEGRNLLELCELIGRHLIHWVREHPGGRDAGDGRVFVRRITFREVER